MQLKPNKMAEIKIKGKNNIDVVNVRKNDIPPTKIETGISISDNIKSVLEFCFLTVI